MKIFNYLLFTLAISLSGCSNKNTDTLLQNGTIQEETTEIQPLKTIHTYQALNDIINTIADQLLESNINKDEKTSIILTSYVNLNSLNETTPFGRIISESMFNELHTRNFKVTDFRGQDAVSVNEDGEFHITRDVERLKDNIESAKYILVGTFAKFENESLLINSRIIDSISGEVISTSRIVFEPKECMIYDVCLKEKLTQENKSSDKKIDELIKNNEKVMMNTPILITKDKK